eukprot:6179229-Pleurochrysis_carterae.AAC.2
MDCIRLLYQAPIGGQVALQDFHPSQEVEIEAVSNELSHASYIYIGEIVSESGARVAGYTTGIPRGQKDISGKRTGGMKKRELCTSVVGRSGGRVQSTDYYCDQAGRAFS